MNCPVCGGERSELGVLGRLRWFRCRACGWEWSKRIRRCVAKIA